MPSHEVYDLGDQPRFSAIFTVAGAFTNPGAVEFKWRTPAGVETTYVYGTDPEIVRPSTGNYYVDLLLDAAGVWLIRWVSSGTCTSADEYRVRVEASAFTDPLTS